MGNTLSKAQPNQAQPQALASSKNYPKKIEDYRKGYPRFAAFLAADPSFLIARRFSNLFARNLLLKQDRLADLEAQLDCVDTAEEVQWYLSSRRADQNPDRIRLLVELDKALHEYETAICSYRNILALPKPSSMSQRDVRRWMDGNKPLVRTETEFLDHAADLVALASNEDRGVVDEAIERCIDSCLPLGMGKKIFATNATRALTGDSHIRLYSPNRIQIFSRLLITLAIVLLLLVPMAALYTLRSDLAKFLVIAFSTLIFASILALATRAKKAEILAAAATYGAVLVVFVTRTQ